MISTFTAFFDANVFYGARLRSLMLFAAQTKIFRARWSDRIHDERIRNLLENRPDLSANDLQRTRDLMNAAVPDCLVTGYEPLIGSLELPDPDDGHVVAAAIMARADVIVTFNERDFPLRTIEPFGLHTKHPDRFLLDLASLEPSIFFEAVRGDFAHYTAPPLTFAEYADSLRRAGVPEAADWLTKVAVLFDAGMR